MIVIEKKWINKVIKKHTFHLYISLSFIITYVPSFSIFFTFHFIIKPVLTFLYFSCFYSISFFLSLLFVYHSTIFLFIVFLSKNDKRRKKNFERERSKILDKSFNFFSYIHTLDKDSLIIRTLQDERKTKQKGK